MSNTTSSPARSVRGARVLTVATGVVAAAAVWIVADRLAKVTLDVKSGSKVQHVPLPAAILVSLLAGLAAWGVAALLERRASRPARTWLIAGTVVLLISLAGPLGGVDTSAKVSLACEHLAVAAVLIPGMARTLPGRR